MKITSLRVSGCGRFSDPVELVCFDDGLNVFAAPNEAGKSTLFRALRHGLITSHTSNRKRGSGDIGALRSALVDAPVQIDIGFEIAGDAYLLEKRFLKSVSSQLSQNGHPIGKGREADEAVRDLIGFREGEAGVLGLMWVDQSAGLEVPEPAKDQSDLISSLIEAEVGSIVGGDQARDLLSRVEAEIGEHKTAGQSKPKAGGALKREQDEVARLTAQQSDAISRLNAQEARFDALGEARRRVSELTDPHTRQILVEKRDTAAAQLRDAQKTRDALKEASLDLKLSRVKLDGLESELLNRQKRLAAAEAIKCRIAETQSELDALNASTGETQTVWNTVQTSREKIVAASNSAQASLRFLERMLELAGAKGRADVEAKQLAKAQEVVTEYSRTKAQLNAIAITDDNMMELRSVFQGIERTRAQISAQSATLTIDLEAEYAARATLNDEPLGAGSEIEVTGRQSLHITGVGQIVVQPPHRDHAGIKNLHDLEAQAQTILARSDVQSLAEAEQAYEERRRLNTSCELLLNQAAVLLDVPLDANTASLVPKRLAELKSMANERSVELEELLNAAEQEELPTLQDLHERQSALRAQVSALAADLAANEVERERLAETLRRFAERRGHLEGTLASDSGQLKAIDREILGQTQTTDDLKALHAQASRSLALLEERYAAQAAIAPTEDRLEQMQTSLSRLEQSVLRNDEAASDARRTIAQLESAISAVGGDGLGELVAGLEDDLKAAQGRLSAIERRIAALELLRDRLKERLSQAQATYLKPVMRAMAPFVADVFPGATLRFSEHDLKAVQFDRSGLAEPINALSQGTREQLSVLVRLGFARMLNETGRQLPLVLDDPLAYCDDRRYERMFDALHRAAQSHQVIVFTCHDMAFQTLGGRRLSLDPVSIGD